MRWSVVDNVWLRLSIALWANVAGHSFSILSSGRTNNNIVLAAAAAAPHHAVLLQQRAPIVSEPHSALLQQRTSVKVDAACHDDGVIR